MRVAGARFRTHHPVLPPPRRGSVTVTTDHARVVALPGEWVITTSKKREHRFSDDARMISLNLKAHWGRRQAPSFPMIRPSTCARPISPALEDAAHRPPQADRPASPIARRPDPMARRRQPHHPGRLSPNQPRHPHAAARLRIGHALRRPHAKPRPSNPTRGPPRPSASSISTRSPATSIISGWRMGWGSARATSHASFVEQFSITPRQYEFKRRLQRARDMLSDSRLPIKQVAYLLGFRQPSHFTGWFRKHTGRSPRLYARSRATLRAHRAPPGSPCARPISPAPPPHRAATADAPPAQPLSPADSAAPAATQPSASLPYG